MHDFAPILVFAVVALFIAAAIFGATGARKRKKELGAFCKANGLDFDPARRSNPADQFTRLELLQQGHSRYGDNWCEGNWRGRPFCFFDHHYTTGSGKDQTSHSLSVMAVENSAPLKSLMIRPEGFFDKVGEFFGAGNPFRVRPVQPLLPRGVRRSQVGVRCPVAALAGAAAVGAGGIHIQFGGQRVFLWDGDTWTSQEITQRAQLISGLLDLIPDFALREASQ